MFNGATTGSRQAWSANYQDCYMHSIVNWMHLNP